MPKPNVLIKRVWLLLVIVGLLVFLNLAHAQQEQRGQTSYMKVDSTEPFAAFMARMTAAKPGIEKEHNALLSERYDLSDHPAQGVTMDRGKPLQEGVRVKLPAGMTEDRRSAIPSIGSACFDCHSNGHQNGATHLAPDTRPQQFRHRIKTLSLRGVDIQRLFGSQRALKTIEDFTEFEQRTAYFDGDIVIAAKKGVNPLERGSQVDFMADFQEMLDFPPAPKLDVLGKLIPSKATAAEMRGQEIFFGKGQCASCHQPPFYTDNLMHNLQTERFFKPVMINNMMAIGDGPIKTFALRGVKDNPPYMHDERLLTMEDTVEFFNLILGTKLAPQEKQDLVAFLSTL